MTRPTTSAALIALTILATVPRAHALEVCRENALGQVACSGTPTKGLRPLVPFRPTRNGLDRVRPQVSPDKPGMISSERTNAFGDTILKEGEASRPKSRICRVDTLGNLDC